MTVMPNGYEKIGGGGGGVNKVYYSLCQNGE